MGVLIDNLSGEEGVGRTYYTAVSRRISAPTAGWKMMALGSVESLVLVVVLFLVLGVEDEEEEVVVSRSHVLVDLSWRRRG